MGIIVDIQENRYYYFFFSIKPMVIYAYTNSEYLESILTL